MSHTAMAAEAETQRGSRAGRCAARMFVRMSSGEEMAVLEGQTSIDDLLAGSAHRGPDDPAPLQECLPGMENMA